MKTNMQAAAVVFSALALSACGGSGEDTNTQQNKLHSTASTSVVSPQAAQAEYTDVVHRMYLAFFGRPADAHGLAFWVKAFSENNAPTTIDGFITAYAVNDGAKALVDAFEHSRESRQLYTGTNAAFINAVYLNAFNRNAEAGGRDFWSSVLDNGYITRAQAAMAILSGAQNEDALVVAKKVQAATYFTAAMRTPTDISGYDGPRPNQAARELLGTITVDTDMEAFKTKIDDFIASFGSPNPFPAVAYYSGFNFLQRLSNAPSYSARYEYAEGFIPAQRGMLTFGEVPQTVSWTRDVTTYAYAAPYNANISLGPGNGVVPSIAMLCRPPTVAEGGSPAAVKSTDVLIAGSTTRLVDASQLAGQTLAVFRQNCSAGSADESFSFDKLGNATFKTVSGTVNFDAATVTAALMGQVLFQTSANQKFAFAGYSYTLASGAKAYAIVQLAETDGQTVLPSGAIAIWSQE